MDQVVHERCWELVGFCILEAVGGDVMVFSLAGCLRECRKTFQRWK